MKSPLFWLSIVAITGLLVWSVKGGAKAKPDAVKAKIDQGAVVVDVRTPGEYTAAHWPGATNIPLHELRDRLGEIGPKNKPVVLYCRTGNRSGQALRLLREAGFTDVINAGGLTDMPR